MFFLHLFLKRSEKCEESSNSKLKNFKHFFLIQKIMHVNVPPLLFLLQRNFYGSFGFCVKAAPFIYIVSIYTLWMYCVPVQRCPHICSFTLCGFSYPRSTADDPPLSYCWKINNSLSRHHSAYVSHLTSSQHRGIYHLISLQEDSLREGPHSHDFYYSIIVLSYLLLLLIYHCT